MKKQTLSSLLSLTLIVACTFGIQQHANALVIIDAVNTNVVPAAFSEDGDAEARLFFVYPIGITFLAGVGAIGGPIGAVVGGVIGLLDNPSDAMSKISQGLASKYPSLNQHQEEAQNLSALIVNSSILEQRQGKQMSLTKAQIADAAPNFAGSSDYQKFLRDLSQAAQ